MAVQKGLDPVYNAHSKILVLGSFPSVLSRGTFYYGNPRNRFWSVLGETVGEPAPDGTEARREWLLRHGIALWDLVGQCEIQGSADSDIKIRDRDQINDIPALIAKSRVGAVFCNGTKSYSLLKKYFPTIYDKAVLLPSTSPANFAFEGTKWRIISEYLK